MPRHPCTQISVRNIVHCLRCIVSGKSFILPSATWTSDTKKRLCVLCVTTIALLIARFKVMGSQLPVFTRYVYEIIIIECSILVHACTNFAFWCDFCYSRCNGREKSESSTTTMRFHYWNKWKHRVNWEVEIKSADVIFAILSCFARSPCTDHKHLAVTVSCEYFSLAISLSPTISFMNLLVFGNRQTENQQTKIDFN